jgi:MFS family permease
MVAHQKPPAADQKVDHPMSTDATGVHPPAERDAAPRFDGVMATWRQTPRATRALLGGVFVSKLASFVQIFLVLFLTHRGFSAGQAGLALGLYGAGAVLGTFVGGWLSDRLSARSAMLISMFGAAMLIIAILYLKYYALILLAVLLVSMVGQVYRPAAQALIADLTPPHRLVMVTAMYRLCLNLGTSAAPLIGVALLSVSYDLLFWAEATAAVVYGLIALTALPRRTRSASRSVPATVNPSGSGYRMLLADVRYLAFLAAIFLRGSVYVLYTTALPLAIDRAGLSLWWYSVVVSLNAILVVACEVVTTRFTQTWPLRRTAVIAFGLLAVGYAVYAIGMVPAILILGTLIWTASEIIGAPTAFAYPSIVAPAGLRGRYIGAMQSVFGLGTVIGPILGVIMLDRLGDGVWLLAAAVALVSTASASFGMHHPRIPPRPEPAAVPAV